MPMRILLAAATTFEVRTVVERFSVETVITGVGLVSTTYHLQKALSISQPDLVIQAGIGGCFDTDRPLGTLVAVKEEVIGDQGVEEQGRFRDLFELSFADPDLAPYTNARLVNPHLDKFNLMRWPEVSGLSVNEVSTRQDRIVHWNTTYRPTVESMEGAALHFVCGMEGVPFIQVRALSNYIGERDKHKWDITGAIKNLNDGVGSLIQKLTI